MAIITLCRLPFLGYAKFAPTPVRTKVKIKLELDGPGICVAGNGQRLFQRLFCRPAALDGLLQAENLRKTLGFKFLQHGFF